MCKIDLVLTCSVCPEQYDVYVGQKRVGYIRLRWGTLLCRYSANGVNPVKGKVLLCHEFDNEYKGCFDKTERKFWLEKCKEAILKRYKRDLKRTKRLRRVK